MDNIYDLVEKAKNSPSELSEEEIQELAERYEQAREKLKSERKNRSIGYGRRFDL